MSAAEEAVRPPDFAAVADAARLLEGVAKRTPVVTSRTLDERLGARVFLKCENLQRMGAFKFRGAYNAVARLAPEVRARGVLAYSSGNHAQAVALAARLLGTRATVVMPADAPASKRAAAEGYGARIVSYEATGPSREELAARLMAEAGPGREPALVPPFDHPHVIAGQATVARELFEEVGPLDVLLVPCGGGGLLAGCALSAATLSPGCRVMGVEPEAGDDGLRSFRSGTIVSLPAAPQTIADGARVTRVGEITFPMIRALVADMHSVPDTALVAAMRFVWQRLKLVVEPTGVLGLAAALTGRVELTGRRVGVVLSGGNVDLDRALALLAAP